MLEQQICHTVKDGDIKYVMYINPDSVEFVDASGDFAILPNSVMRKFHEVLDSLAYLDLREENEEKETEKIKESSPSVRERIMQWLRENV